MLRLVGRLLLAGLFGAVAVAVVFGGYLGVRHLARGPAAGDAALEALLVAVATGALVALAVRWRAGRERRLLLAQVEQHLAGLRENPAPHAIEVRGAWQEPALAGVRREAGQLAGCYREALAQVVKVGEKLDRLRAVFGE